MNGNQSLTKEQFVKQLGHPRKIELATMLFEEKTTEEMNTAGFNELTIKEMRRDIEKNVKAEETPVETTEEATTNENENKTTTEGNDSVDESAAGENQVVDQVQDTQVPTENLPEGEQDQEVPGTTQA